MLRLLLVDDEYVECQAMQAVFGRKYGDVYEIKTASNGLQAVELSKTYLPHLIFMDIKMPGCSGIEAAKQIKTFAPDTYIVFVTAYDYFDYAKEAIAVEAAELLLKPVDIDTVLELTDRLTEKIQTQIEINRKNKLMENKFELITRQAEAEFIEMLGNFNTNPEQLGNYLHIMDIIFYCGIAVTVNLSPINESDTVNAFQKGMIKGRLIEKIQEFCEQDGIVLISGVVGDAAKFVFIFDKAGLDVLELAAIVENRIRMGLKAIEYVLSYGISEPVYQISLLQGAMYNSGMKAFDIGEKNDDSYPYELEKDCVHAIQKLDLERARERIQQIATVLQKEYQYRVDFNRQATGLYVVLKRAIRQKFGSNVAIAEHADDMIENVYNYSTMMSFFGTLIDYVDEVVDKKENRNEQLIHRVCEYVNENYKREISLEEAAGIAGFSTYYFVKLFKEYQGMSFVDYLVSVRTEHAKQLFDTTDMNISEVGSEVGYNDPNYFTRVFKKVEGLTPSVYKSKKETKK